MQIELKKYRYDQVVALYPKLHAEVFGAPDPAHAPAVVYLVFQTPIAQDTEPAYIGFFAGYYHDAVTLYIQRMGIPAEDRGRRQVLGLLKQITDRLRDEGHRFLMASIEAGNRIALLLCLRDHWQIHGVHADTAGQLYVDMIKEL